jgi:hypothetical protein
VNSLLDASHASGSGGELWHGPKRVMLDSRLANESFDMPITLRLDLDYNTARVRLPARESKDDNVSSMFRRPAPGVVGGLITQMGETHGQGAQRRHRSAASFP